MSDINDFLYKHWKYNIIKCGLSSFNHCTRIILDTFLRRLEKLD